MESNDTSGPSFNEGSYMRWIVFCLSGLCHEPKHKRGSLHHIRYSSTVVVDELGLGWRGYRDIIVNLLSMQSHGLPPSPSPPSFPSNSERFLGGKYATSLSFSYFWLSSPVGKHCDRILLECVKHCSGGICRNRNSSRESFRTQIVSQGLFCPF